MAYLFWKNGRMEVPPCERCQSVYTTEEQNRIGGNYREIFIKCMQCGYQVSVGVHEHLGGHSFKKVDRVPAYLGTGESNGNDFAGIDEPLQESTPWGLIIGATVGILFAILIIYACGRGCADFF